MQAQVKEELCEVNKAIFEKLNILDTSKNCNAAFQAQHSNSFYIQNAQKKYYENYVQV